MSLYGIDDLYSLLQQSPWQAALEEWCERCETHWTAAQDEWKEDEIIIMTQEEKAVFVSKQLLHFIECASKRNIKAFQLNKDIHDDTLNNDNTQPPELRLLLRTSKNFLRGILQATYSSTNSKFSKIMTAWRSITLLRQYLAWIQQYCVHDPILAQHASQILFYTSYNPRNDDAFIESYEQLLEQDKIMFQLLSCLVRSVNDISLALSIVRNVHNIVVSFPRGVEYTLAAQVTLDHDTIICLQDNNNNTATFALLLSYLALQALETEPPRQDKRAELVVEILRAAYVLRLGRQLDSDPLFAKLIAKLLRLDATTTTSTSTQECRREAIPPLMDAPAEAVGTFVLTEDVLPALWDILEQQVTQVLDQTLVHDSAAAALTPILVVLHKLSTHHNDIRQQLKAHIFPAEGSFLEKKRQEIEQHGKCRNMKPLDAPSGTLRYRLIQLMTWPQSHIKRFTGELVWSVCDGDAQEFIARVGMGNAVVILGARGLVQLPGQISSSS